MYSMTIRRLFTAVAAAALVAVAPQALAVPFTVTSAALTTGSGYGGGSETGGTSLNVAFTNTFTTQSFSLDAGHPSETFTAGTVNFLEANGQGGILAGETDNLGVAWSFTFTNPLSAGETLTAVATATVGLVNDAADDFVIDWTPISVAFGNGGAFSISLNDLTFANNSGGPKNQTVTFTLTQAPIVAAPAAVRVPEPGTLALMGLGLAALGVVRRRRSHR